jgi:hypothetical protein
MVTGAAPHNGLHPTRSSAALIENVSVPQLRARRVRPGVRRLTLSGNAMRPKLLFAASALALVVGLVSIAMLMEMYDVKPHSWGPQGIGFAE